MVSRFFVWLARTFVFRFLMTIVAGWVAWLIHAAWPDVGWLTGTLLAIVIMMVLGWWVKPLIWGQKKSRQK